MGRPPQDVTDAELAILQVLWEQGSLPIRKLTEELYPGGKTAQYATVQKLLERLEAKDCVARNRAAPVHIFQATIDRNELVGRRLKQLADKLCGGSWTPVLTHLVHTEDLTAQDRQALRQLVEDLDQAQPKKEKRGKRIL
jgi:BlaI family transcriptional regulator, penicillinase repressor